jgi:putative Mg2+ transporter-C (MgtC) family protein
MHMANDLDALARLAAALLAGALIGAERSYHGRPAGFRTHALVCVSAALLMLVTVYQPFWFPQADDVRLDPTRMGQGIVTGIGFLGAGVIFKEGLTVRGLTTAASIWITSAIGLLMGIALYVPAAAATVIALFVLTLFRRIEQWIPVNFFAIHVVRFAREDVMPEERLRALIAEHGFKVGSLSYRLTDEGRKFEYRMAIRTRHEDRVGRLARTLAATPSVREFTIAPQGD